MQLRYTFSQLKELENRWSGVGYASGKIWKFGGLLSDSPIKMSTFYLLYIGDIIIASYASPAHITKKF